jgi:hypothetical protein
MPWFKQRRINRYKSKLEKLEYDVKKLGKFMWSDKVNNMKRTQLGFKMDPSRYRTEPSYWVTEPWQNEVNRLQARRANLQHGPFLYTHNEKNLNVLRRTQEDLNDIQSRLKEWQDQRWKLAKKHGQPWV